MTLKSVQLAFHGRELVTQGVTRIRPFGPLAVDSLNGQKLQIGYGHSSSSSFEAAIFVTFHTKNTAILPGNAVTPCFSNVGFSSGGAWNPFVQTPPGA
jgi:hypothetical protein